MGKKKKRKGSSPVYRAVCQEAAKSREALKQLLEQKQVA